MLRFFFPCKSNFNMRILFFFLNLFSMKLPICSFCILYFFGAVYAFIWLSLTKTK